MKIRLHVWNTKCSYKRNKSDITCPLFRTEEDTTENITVCQEGNNIYNLLDENEKAIAKITLLPVTFAQVLEYASLRRK